MGDILALACTLLLPFAAPAEQLKLRIASEGTNPPFSTINSDGKLEGFDVDIANALCSKMDAECEIVAQDWEGIIPALLAQYVAIAASVNVTADRAKVVAFTKPYYHSPSVFVVRKGTDVKDLSPKALAGKTVGVQSSTNHSAFMETNTAIPSSAFTTRWRTPIATLPPAASTMCFTTSLPPTTG